MRVCSICRKTIGCAAHFHANNVRIDGHTLWTYQHQWCAELKRANLEREVLRLIESAKMTCLKFRLIAIRRHPNCKGDRWDGKS